MIETLFYFLIIAATAIFIWGVRSQLPVFFAVSGILFLFAGGILADEGIEKLEGYKITQKIETTGGVTDINVTVDNNYSYLRTTNDNTVNLLSMFLLYGGIGLTLLSVGFYMYSWRR